MFFLNIISLIILSVMITVCIIESLNDNPDSWVFYVGGILFLIPTITILLNMFC